MKNIFKRMMEFLRNAPRTLAFTCDTCGREIFSGERVCEACKRNLPYPKEICPHCGREVLEAGVCLECKEKPLAVKRARSLCVHEGEAARLVLSFKRGKRYLRFAFAELLLPLAEREFSQTELILGVPMTERARKKRGYNQSQLAAEELALRWGKPYFSAVEKRRETDAQKTLSRGEREENLKGCFHLVSRAEMKGKSVLIVDDVLTTGSTVSELARVLYRAGAKEVNCVTLTGVPQKTIK